MSEKENEAEAWAKSLAISEVENVASALTGQTGRHAASLLRSQADRIRELEGALEPFAAITTMKPWPDNKHIAGMTVGLVRSARTALRGEKEKASV